MFDGDGKYLLDADKLRMAGGPMESRMQGRAAGVRGRRAGQARRRSVTGGPGATRPRRWRATSSRWSPSPLPVRHAAGRSTWKREPGSGDHGGRWRRYGRALRRRREGGSIRNARRHRGGRLRAPGHAAGRVLRVLGPDVGDGGRFRLPACGAGGAGERPFPGDSRQLSHVQLTGPLPACGLFAVQLRQLFVQFPLAQVRADDFAAAAFGQIVCRNAHHAV